MPMPVQFTETEIPGVLEVHTGRAHDERGFFSETWSEKTWAEAGFTEQFRQDCLSCSARGVVRGMHYQLEPWAMGKLVRVVRGAIFDVGIDLRKSSPTFGKWIGRTLSAENGHALYLPPGFAHGFEALEDNTLVYYKCTAIHTPEAERAISCTDPALDIPWPIPPRLISAKDQAAPPFAEAEMNFE